MATTSFKDLIVWQKSCNVAVETYSVTSKFPQSELYGLTSQMRRASVSISSNIAEGYQRLSQKEKNQFYSIAYGSASELQSQIEVSKKIFRVELDTLKLEEELVEVSKMLNKMLATHRY